MSVLWPKLPSQSQDGVWGCCLGLWSGRRWSSGIPRWWGVPAPRPSPGLRAKPLLCPGGKSFSKPVVPDLSPSWLWVLRSENKDYGCYRPGRAWYKGDFNVPMGVAAGGPAKGSSRTGGRWSGQKARSEEPAATQRLKYLLDKLIRPKLQTKSGWWGGGGVFVSLSRVLWFISSFSARQNAVVNEKNHCRFFLGVSKAIFQVGCRSLTLLSSFSLENLLWLKTKPYALCCELDLTFRSPNRFSKERFCCTISFGIKALVFMFSFEQF